jgi:S1-C subfamily serine protease
MLGMKAGDRIVQANGIALLAIDDVLSAIVKPLSASQPVRLSGARGGKPREWLFLNAGACPG